MARVTGPRLGDQIPGPDPGACPKCGRWRKAGMLHICPLEVSPNLPPFRQQGWHGRKVFQSETGEYLGRAVGEPWSDGVEGAIELRQDEEGQILRSYALCGHTVLDKPPETKARATIIADRCRICGAEMEVELGPESYSLGKYLLSQHLFGGHTREEIARVYALGEMA